MPRHHLRSPGLRAGMLLLIVLITLPALGLSVYTAFEQRRLAVEHAQENALRLAHTVAESQKRMADAAQHLLVGLSHVPAVRTGEAGACSALMADLLRRYPGYANLGVVLPNGNVACSALQVPAGYNIAGRTMERAVRRAMGSREQAVEDYLIGSVTGRPVVMVSYPVRGNERSVERVIFASIDLSWLNEIATSVQLPPSGTLTVLTEQGTVLARYPNPEQWVGRSVPETALLRTIVQHNGEGTARVAGLDGIRRLYAFARLSPSDEAEGVYVSIGIPEAFVLASANRGLVRNLALLALVALLALLAAWIGAKRFILQPIDALLETTRRLAAGDLSTRSHVHRGSAELTQLATAFDEMAEALQSRTAEAEQRAEALRESEERRRFAMEAAGVGTWDSNIETGELVWSDTLLALYGLTADDFGGTYEDFLDLVHPDDRQRLCDTIAHCLAEGSDYSLDTRTVLPDGSIRWIAGRGRVLHNEAGKPVRMMGIGMDITERKQAEVALQRAEQQAQRMADRMRAVAVAAADVIGADSVGALRDVLREACGKVVSFDVSTFALYDESTHTFSFLETYDAGVYSASQEVPAAGTPAEWVVRNRRSLLTHHAGEPAGLGATVIGTGRPSESTIRAPVLSGDTVLAVLSVQSYTPDHYQAEDVEVLEALAALAAPAILNIRLLSQIRASGEALHESEERYRLVAKATNEVIYDWDVEHNHLMWNDALFGVLGLERAQVEPTIEWWEQQIHPADREVVLSSLQSAVYGGGESWVEEYRFRRGDGAYATLLDRGYIVHTDQGAPARMIGSMLDLTERKRAEEAQQFLVDASRMLASSIDYPTTLRSVAEIAVSRLADICVIDLIEEDGTIRREVSLHADTTKQDLLLELARRFPPGPNNRRGAAALVLRARKSVFIPDVTDDLLERQITDEEHRRLFRALEPRSHITVPLIARGRLVGALSLTAVASARPYTQADLALAEDLGTRAAFAIDNALLYRQAHAARQEAEAANQAKSGFLAVISHELRTPLTSVISFAELLEAEISGPLNEQQREQVTRISSSGWHLTRLVEEILEYTRVEAGRAVVQREIVDIVETAHETVAQMTPLAAEKGLQLHADLPDRPVHIETDPAKARQILLNLLSNAIKFTDTGEIRLVLHETDHQIILQVRDTGVGIAPEHQTQIFDAFWQVEAPLTRRAGGTGLGLSIVRQLTHLLGGEIGVESTVGVGSVFTVTLPRRLSDMNGPVKSTNDE